MKLYKENSKKFIALALSSVIALTSMITFGGCNKSEKSEKKEVCKIIDQYSLPDTLVVTRSDETIDIAEKVYVRESIFALSYEHNDHDHYRSLITKEIYSTNECNIAAADYTMLPGVSAGTMMHYSQLNSKNISYYLTPDELLKIKNGEFTKTDEDNVLKRIMESNVELENSTEDKIVESIKETTENVTETPENQIGDINKNVKTYNLKELYVSETTSPFNESTMPYIFLQMDYNQEYYREYHGEFFTVHKDSYSAREGAKNNFQDWNPMFVVSDSIEPISIYLTEEEMKNSKNGQLTELQLDCILARIRSDYRQQLSENNYSKGLTK